uniref:C2 domain-containing protein n=1 Tax=Heliothis virescens TaxID=7102 RepID=A0A2A4JU35_HELVI
MMVTDVRIFDLQAKTAVQSRNNHPTYCEQISIVEMFPSMSEMIKLEVCSGEGCFNRVIASAHLKLGQISHDGENGFLPTFGPSLLHMYGTSTAGTLAATGEDGPYHRGAMLVSLRTIVPYYQQGLRTTSVEPVAPLQPESLWLMEDFCIFCPILEVSMLDRRISGKLCGIAITVGELPTDDQGDEEFVTMMNEIRTRKLYYTGSMDVLKTRPVHGYLDFDNTFPVLQLATRLPDFRFRMYRNNMVYGIVTELEQALTEVERRLKNSEYNSLRDLTDDINRSVDDAAGNILKFLDIIQYSSPSSSVESTMAKYSTELDNKQLALQKEEIESLWLMEDFCIFCPILEVSMLDRRISGKLCGIAITVGELPTDDQGDEEFVTMMNEIRTRKLYYTGSMDVLKTRPVHGYLDFDNTFPVLQLATRLPDFRFRMYRNNMVYGIVTELEQALTEVERRLKNSEYNSLRDLTDDINRSVDDAAGNILKFLDIIQYSSPSSSVESTMAKYSTELDNKQLALQKEEIEKIYQQISKRMQRCASTMSLINSITQSESVNSTKRDVKLMLADIRLIAENLKSLIYKTSEGWPDIVVWLLNGGSRVAFYKMSIADIVYSVIPEQNGRHCGRIQSVYLKPLKCPKHVNTLSAGCCCIAGKVELILWMGPYRQIHAFETCLPKGYKLKVKDYDMCLKTSTMMLECRVFIYRAKLNESVDRNNHAHPFVRVNTLNAVKETKIEQKTLTPVWNQVLKIHKLVSATHDRIQTSPPLVMVEVMDSDQSIPETLMKSTVYGPVEETYVASGVKVADLESDEPEPLPPNLIPKATTYKVDIYWWGLRDVTTTRKPCVVLEIDELTIKSDVVCDKKSNCNFPNGRSSQTFQAPLNEIYCPPLSIRLYDSSTFGRTLFLGTNIVKNPNKYIVSWIPKVEREASLRSVSITASSFYQVSQILYIKKGSSPSMDNLSTKTSSRSIQETKRPRWKRVFCNKEADEEEYVLLPMFSKEKNQMKLAKNNSLECPVYRDWWTRYFDTISNDVNENTPSTDKLVIYCGELEAQPEFSKFKDWCSTLKLYNGKKTGIPEKDDQLYCGYLKAGIAIYRWPPPVDTIAVSCNGVELNHGFFNDYPNNEPSKFLVRVYVVKGVNLVAKAFTGKLDPYVAISCGDKHLGDRKSHVKNTLNPIFGKMYEFRCTLPDDYLLTVSLFDYDTIPPDELIGSTTIDLEDRIYSKHRARVGLAAEYNAIGPNKWRDSQKPSIILEELCSKNHLPPPMFPDNATVIVNGVEYRDNDNGRSFRSAADRKENICLSLLHSWHTLPICGYRLVPEHVESRPLLNSTKNGMEQGKLQMWVDIFPLDADKYIPPGVDITPKKLEEYELRVIIWDVQGIKLDDHGKKVSDIYVRAWIDTIEQAQYTDVHYSSSAGEGSFNWRMIFHFQYHQAEKKLVRKEKGPFTEVEEHMAPIFVVQVLDSDAASQDDFLGRSFRSAADRKENICLSLLHSWHTLPICGYRLVPEHVESRPLLNSTKNGMEQGKLQMWVDIFPLDADKYIPPGVDITPKKLEEYELRVIIWDVQGIKLDDHGKKVSDIYVRAWIDTIEQAQYTDVHYSSSAGEGSFNWRMIFHFQYHQAEKKLVRKEKGPFTEVEEHMAPIFVVQVLDSDAASQDDFLASVSFNLNSMSRGVKQPYKCNAEEIEKNKKINLFSVTTIRAWWPLVYTNRNTGLTSAAGTIDLEMSLLPKEKALMMPVGLGREPPAPLPDPA